MINTDGKVFKLGQCGLEPVKSLTGDQLQTTGSWGPNAICTQTEQGAAFCHEETCFEYVDNFGVNVFILPMAAPMQFNHNGGQLVYNWLEADWQGNKDWTLAAIGGEDLMQENVVELWTGDQWQLGGDNI